MKRLPKQRYTLEVKQEAVRQIEVEGKRQAEVARELGVVEQTLHGWRKAHRQGNALVHPAMASRSAPNSWNFPGCAHRTSG